MAVSGPEAIRDQAIANYRGRGIGSVSEPEDPPTGEYRAPALSVVQDRQILNRLSLISLMVTSLI